MKQAWTNEKRPAFWGADRYHRWMFQTCVISRRGEYAPSAHAFPAHAGWARRSAAPPAGADWSARLFRRNNHKFRLRYAATLIQSSAAACARDPGSAGRWQRCFRSGLGHVNFHFQKRYSVARGTAKLLRKQQIWSGWFFDFKRDFPWRPWSYTKKRTVSRANFFTLVYKKPLLIIHFSY